MNANQLPSGQTIASRAFDQVRHCLGSHRESILKILADSGEPMTANQITKILRNVGDRRALDNLNTRPRLRELRLAGKIVIAKEGVCPVSGSYLHWLWSNGKSAERNCPVADYIRRNIDALKREHPDGVWT